MNMMRERLACENNKSQVYEIDPMAQRDISRITKNKTKNTI